MEKRAITLLKSCVNKFFKGFRLISHSNLNFLPTKFLKEPNQISSSCKALINNTNDANEDANDANYANMKER
jgi:hypothetical protein